MSSTTPDPLRPPFTKETALAKVQRAEDAWNSRDPKRVALAYSVDSHWRNREEFFQGRKAIEEFLTRKWEKELDYRLEKELWAFDGNRISVRFEYEWHDAGGQWYRTHGNEHWEFDDDGLMRRRDMSANDIAIDKAQLRIKRRGGLGEPAASAESARAGLHARVSQELRERPMAYGVLALFMLLGPAVTPFLFPEAPPGVSILGGLAFGAYAALCAVPEKFL